MDNYHYGVVGNCKSAALVSLQGAIDWCCLPDFDSPSVFAKILDEKKGGSFEVHPAVACTTRQAYVRHTNILSTVFECPDFAFEIIDFMPIYHRSDNPSDCYSPPDLVRLFRPLRGRPVLRLVYDPRLHYAEHETRTVCDHGCLKSATARGVYESMYLYSDLNLEAVAGGTPIELDREAFVLISYNQKIIAPSLDEVRLQHQKTQAYWLDWVAHIRRYPEYQEEICRSALVLKMLTTQRTGAVLAALTTSLPESLGEERNWDYRFCWIRDASMLVEVFLDLGLRNTGRRFINYILGLVSHKDEQIQIMYGIRGQRELTERTLDHLPGYQGSAPVRVGNAAYSQKQNDIYGVLLDVIYKGLPLFNRQIDKLDELWTLVRTLVRRVSERWQLPDQGIWEIRGGPEHFVFSKVLCWVAVDRGVRIAETFGKSRYVSEWSGLRSEIHDDIHAKGWNEQAGAFTQSYGSAHLDSANLLMEEYGFIDAGHPRYQATVRRTLDGLCVDGLLYRYRNSDDFGTPRSAFTVCTFWMINALARIGRKQEARDMFRRLLGYANHAGLFGEDIDFATKRQLGNFPQAYSHLALIQCAITLGEEAALSEGDRLANRFCD